MLLNDVKILDLTRVLAGPFSTMLLADLGAEVIKVESHEGDETRRYTPIVDGVSAYFYSINRGKKSICLNLKREEDYKILLKLIEWSDVVIHNFRDDTAKRLRVDFKSLTEINPKLIYCVIRGYDSNTKYRDDPAYDITIQGRSGLMMATGYPDQGPVRVGFALTDIFAGLYCATSILAALRKADRDKPIKIEVNLYDSLIYSMSYLVYSYLLAGKEPGRFGSGHPSIVPYQAFRCKDGKYIIVAAANNRIFERLCKALDMEHLLKDRRFRDNVDRVRHRDILIKILENRFMDKDSGEWIDILRKFDVPVSPVNTVGEAMEEEYVYESGLVGILKDNLLGEVKFVKPPIKVNGVRLYNDNPPPKLDEHRREILDMLGQ